MPIPCPPSSLLLPDDRVLLTSREEDGLTITAADPQVITSVSSLPWVPYDAAKPGFSWTPASVDNYSEYLRVGKYFQFKISYVFKASPVFDGGVFQFQPPPGMTFRNDRVGDGMVVSEPAYWMALDSSTTQRAEGQVCYVETSILNLTFNLFLRTGDDITPADTGLGSASLAWAVDDQIYATGVAELH